MWWTCRTASDRTDDDVFFPYASVVAAGTQVAIKVVHRHFIEQPGAFERFLREMEIGQSLDHPNIVRTFDGNVESTQSGRVHYLVMEYVDGQTLSELAQEIGREKSRKNCGNCERAGHDLDARYCKYCGTHLTPD